MDQYEYTGVLASLRDLLKLWFMANRLFGANARISFTGIGTWVVTDSESGQCLAFIEIETWEVGPDTWSIQLVREGEPAEGKDEDGPVDSSVE